MKAYFCECAVPQDLSVPKISTSKTKTQLPKQKGTACAVPWSGSLFGKHHALRCLATLWTYMPALELSSTTRLFWTLKAPGT